MAERDSRRRVLVIEDDEDIALSLKYNLEREGGYAVQIAADGDAGLRLASERRPDVVVLDLNLPTMDGFAVCRTLRSRPGGGDVPIIMLTARVEETDKIVGLELGADDYVTKPFSMKEILARIRAVLRRRDRQAEEPSVHDDGLIHLDPTGHVLRVAGRELALTRKEFELLAALVKRRGRVLSRDTLLQTVWGYDYFGETRTVDVHIRRLRKKLGAEAAERIETVVGVGYRYRAAE